MTDPTPKPRAEVWRPFIAGQARPCGKCGIPIIFGANRVPLDLTTLSVLYSENVAPPPEWHREAIGWECRSHFETCKHAAEFSGKGRR